MSNPRRRATAETLESELAMMSPQTITLPPAFAGFWILWALLTWGSAFAPPQALCCRLLRRLSGAISRCRSRSQCTTNFDDFHCGDFCYDKEK